jgi:putative protease
VATKADVQPAKSDQSDAKRRTMAKLGDSVYRLNTLTDLTGDTFIPQSQLAELRRSATAALDRAIRIGHKPDYRHSENAQAVFPTGTLTYHANVANALAKEFYQRHGATTAGMALETATDQKLKQMDRTVVMTTRYCLRGELGCCLKTAAADRLPARLFLQSGKTKMEVKCDCAKCEMNLLYIAPKS